jgi:hypothetical protein
MQSFTLIVRNLQTGMYLHLECLGIANLLWHMFQVKEALPSLIVVGWET